MEKDRLLQLTTEDGKEVNAEILFTYHSDEFNSDYVVFVVEGSEEAGAAKYIADSETSGHLEAVQTDAEWQLLEELLSEYLESEEEE